MQKKIPLEKTFRKKFIADLLAEFGNSCRITPNDPQLQQGIPDTTMNCIFDDGVMWWKDLEFKRTRRSPRRPNQAHYIGVNGLFVSPQNRDEVLNEIRSEISAARGRTRVPKSE